MNLKNQKNELRERGVADGLRQSKRLEQLRKWHRSEQRETKAFIHTLNAPWEKQQEQGEKKVDEIESDEMQDEKKSYE